jgi:hypothetical protein
MAQSRWLALAGGSAHHLAAIWTSCLFTSLPLPNFRNGAAELVLHYGAWFEGFERVRKSDQTTGRILHLSRHKGTALPSTQTRTWCVSSADYDFGYLDDETCKLEPAANPFGPKMLPMGFGMKRDPRVQNGPLSEKARHGR